MTITWTRTGPREHRVEIRRGAWEPNPYAQHVTTAEELAGAVNCDPGWFAAQSHLHQGCALPSVGAPFPFAIRSLLFD